MSDQSLIAREDVKVDLVNYTNIYQQFGQITFELNELENAALILAAQQFKEIGREAANVDKGQWLSENVKPMPSGKAFAVFSFLVTLWNSSTMITNGESPNSGCVYLCVIDEASRQ